MSVPIGQRIPLNTRRLSETRRIEWTSPLNPDGWPMKIFITVGFDTDGRTPREIFYDSGLKTGSDQETLIRDICVLISVVLQHDGVNLEVFTKSLSRELNLRTGSEDMGSILGVLLSELRRPPQGAGEQKATLIDPLQHADPNIVYLRDVIAHNSGTEATCVFSTQSGVTSGILLSDVVALLRQAARHCDLNGVSQVLDAVLQSQSTDRAAARSIGLESAPPAETGQDAQDNKFALYPNVSGSGQDVIGSGIDAPMNGAARNLLLLAQYFDADQGCHFLVQLLGLHRVLITAADQGIVNVVLDTDRGSVGFSRLRERGTA